MDIESYRDFCLSLPQVTEGFPFDESTLVFKVGEKMFALTGINNFERINLKCDPEKALELRETFDCVQQGYHMSKKHWNTVYLDGSVSDDQIFEWIKDSYDLVKSKLTKKVKAELGFK